MNYAIIPNTIQTHPDITIFDKAVFFKILEIQYTTTALCPDIIKDITEAVRKEVKTYGPKSLDLKPKTKVDRKMVVKSLKKMEDMHIIQPITTKTDFHHKSDRTVNPLPKFNQED